MPERHVWVFFYGSYINFKVLAGVGLAPLKWEVACVMGFDICIAPRTNLVKGTGKLCTVSSHWQRHGELGLLYAHAKEVLGEVYLPEAVLAQTLDGKWMAAMTYICPDMEPRPAEDDYVERIAGPAREFGFPSWYIDRIASFRPCKSANR